MTIDVIAFREDGDLEGPEVFEPLLATVGAALARGAQEINASTPVTPVTVEVTYRIGLRRGQLIEVNDSLLGISWRAQIMDLSHVVSGPVRYTKLELERLR